MKYIVIFFTLFAGLGRLAIGSLDAKPYPERAYEIDKEFAYKTFGVRTITDSEYMDADVVYRFFAEGKNGDRFFISLAIFIPEDAHEINRRNYVLYDGWSVRVTIKTKKYGRKKEKIKTVFEGQMKTKRVRELLIQLGEVEFFNLRTVYNGYEPRTRYNFGGMWGYLLGERLYFGEERTVYRSLIDNPEYPATNVFMVLSEFIRESRSIIGLRIGSK